MLGNFNRAQIIEIIANARELFSQQNRKKISRKRFFFVRVTIKILFLRLIKLK